MTTTEAISTERVSFLINSKGIEPIIANIDLEMVKMKLRDSEEGRGWDADTCETAEVEYKRFLHLNYKFPDLTIVPNRLMDKMWHQHILDTRAYHKDSNTVFGEYFHHFPYFGITSEADRQDLIAAFDITQTAYLKEFGEEMIKDSASGCKSSCNSSGKCTRPK